VVGDVIGYIPSPPANGIHIGSFELHFYGLLIAIAVLVAAWLAQRRWVKLGGFAGTMVPIAFWAVVAGLIGARLYSVATSWQQDTGGNPVQIVEIWNGGLGIWGGVAGGVLGGWLKARRMHVPLPPLLDVVAPTLALAQAIGRWGNYFNQELFGLPSRLPWAVRITDQAQLGSLLPKYRPPLGASGAYLPATFQPTFLYECIWDLITFGLLLLIERRVRLRRGYLFAAYASLYTFGRFFTEYLRIDPAHRYLGLRLNDWTSIGIFVIATAVLLLKGRPKPGDDLVGAPLPAEVLERERARERLASHHPELPEGAVEGRCEDVGTKNETDGVAEPNGEVVGSHGTSAGTEGSAGESGPSPAESREPAKSRQPGTVEAAEPTVPAAGPAGAPGQEE
jgi:prolipoprotein diacylglyceryl transferase